MGCLVYTLGALVIISTMSNDYAANIDLNVLAVVKEELAKKEAQQKKHYFYLSELQNMSREIPGYDLKEDFRLLLVSVVKICSCLIL